MGRLWVKFLLIVSFTSITRSMKLECTYNQTGILYYCNAKNLEITSKDDRTITKVVGEHEKGKKDDDVNTFASDGNNIKYFPKDLEKFFKKLVEIDISNSTLEEITSEDLKPFGKKLKSLWITESKIKLIESNLFQYNPGMSEITLSDNQISFVGSGALSSLKHVKYLGFYNNPCFTGGAQLSSHATEEDIDKILLKIETKCTERDAKPPSTLTPTSTGSGSIQNVIKCFKELKDQSTKTNAKIRTKCKGETPKFKLECIFEALHTYDKYSCYPTVSFGIVSRYNREIQEVFGEHDKFHFKNATNESVQLFKTVGNKVKYFPSKLTSFFINLNEIDISHAQLREITKNDLEEFGEKLKAIRIVYNEISFFEEDLFHHNPNLVELQLDGNRIIFVGTGALSNMKNAIYLSFNNPCYTGKIAYGKVKEVTALSLSIESNCTAKPDFYALRIDEILDTFKELKTEVNKINWNIETTLSATCPVIETSNRKSLGRSLKSIEFEDTTEDTSTNFEDTEIPSNFAEDFNNFMYGNYTEKFYA